MSGWWGWTQGLDEVIQRAMAAGASQEPVELARALQVVADAEPKVVVEIGCDQGGTLLCWRSVCERVYGITTADNSFDSGGSGGPLEAHGAVVHIGDSHEVSSLEWLAAQLGPLPDGGREPVDVLVLDGDHSRAGVYADLAMYGPLVRPGGVIMLHDITWPWNGVHDPRVDVPKVWLELKERGYQTAEIENRDGGHGWGVIYVRPEEDFPAL